MESQTLNIIIVFFIAILIFNFLVVKRKRKYNLPPGPYAFPFIGSVIQLARMDSKMPMRALQKLSKKYGPVISLQLGPVYAVGINGFDAVKELQNHPDFLNRNNDRWLLDKSKGLPLGLVFTENDFWFKTRKTFYRLITEYGFEKKEKTHSLIIEEIEDLIDVWKTQTNKNNGWTKIKISKQFQLVTLNTIWSLQTGERFQSHDDPKLKRLSKLAEQFLAFGGGKLRLFPQLFYMFPRLTGYDIHTTISAEYYKFFNEIIQERLKLGEYEHTPSNFIDAFLKLIVENNPKNLENTTKLDRNNIMDSIYTKQNLIAVLQDLCSAGNDSTSNTINFIIRYLVQNPEAQEKIHNEIDRVVGQNRVVTMDDKSQLIYTQAAIFEGLRISTTGTTFPRRTMRDCKFRGYDIPKGTVLFPNYYGTNMDETVWEDPEKFLPERFLNSDLTQLINTDKIMTFGIGKRNCLGENFAKSSLHLIITTLFQHFKFEVDPEFGVPNTNTSEGMTRNTEPYNIIIRQKY